MTNRTSHSNGIAVDAGALISMSSLSDDLRASILQTLAGLGTLPPQQWPTDQVRPHPHINALYILNATDQLRVFFRRGEDGKITIVDLVNQVTLDRYFAMNPV